MLTSPRTFTPYAFHSVPAAERLEVRSVGCASLLLRLNPEAWETEPHTKVAQPGTVAAQGQATR
jgi:hypothetical protein